MTVRWLTGPAVVWLSVGLPGDATGQALLRGEVVDHDSQVGIVAAEVRIVGGDDARIDVRGWTDEDGAFVLQVPVAGRYDVRVERLGYRDVSGPVEVGDGDTVDLLIRLASQAVPLEPVTVVARRRDEWGRVRRFRERAERLQRFGGGRVYMTEDIDRLRPSSVQELVDWYPWGIRCRPVVLVNGIDSDGSTFGLTPDQILGIELYRRGDQVPAEYYRPGVCGMALVWTRNESAGRDWSWVRLGVAGLIVFFVGTVFH